MKSKAERIKQLKDNLLESHKKMIKGELSHLKYQEIFRSVKLRITEIKQEK